MNLGAARLATEKAVFRPALPLSVLPAFTGGHMATRITYKEQLLHPNWQRKRLEMLDAANFECSSCGATEKTLHVHHKRYIKGRMVWEYEQEDLAVLCDECHASEHANADTLKALLSATSTRTNLALLAGFHNNADWFDPALIDAGREADALAFALGFIACIAQGLEIEEMLKVAEYAASLSGPSSEYRMIFAYSRGNTFGEGDA
jgi:hypothetical protein